MLSYPETARSSDLKDATILNACIIWKTCLKLIELNPSNQKALRKIFFSMLSGGKGEGGGVGGCVMKIFKSLMGALGKIIVTQPKST